MINPNKCLSCGREIDDLNFEGKEYMAYRLTRCHMCRSAEFPRQTIPYCQYAKYWLNVARKDIANGRTIKTG
jgi:DNA-directed RNA polymerase subunit RPC12/RpoP